MWENFKMEDGDYNYQKAYREVKAAKENHRDIEKVTDELKKVLMSIKEESFLIHVMRLILELDTKATSPLYMHLQSPLKLILYVIDMYYSIEVREEVADMDEMLWEEVAILLNEIEMNYFITIGFSNDGDLYHDERDEKVKVALSTFSGYFGNAVLSYEEQTLDRIIRYIKPYDEYIKFHYGFTIDEALKFVLHVRELNNDKLNSLVKPYTEGFSYYIDHPEEWYKLTQTFEERGIYDPSEWWYQPELKGLVETMSRNPGEIHVHDKELLTEVDIDPDSLRHVIEFFSYDKESLRGTSIYYADKRHSELHPLIQMGDKYVCPISKFLLEGLYFRLDEELMRKEPAGKYKQNKDAAFERKVVEVFREFFPNNTKIFTNYSVDGVAENDLLVVFGTTCIVVEIKNCKFREPFRDPMKAYERIKKDYRNAIQLGYEQCKRVERILLSGMDVKIFDASKKGMALLYNLRNKNIGEVWSIVVTDVKYGNIQTDLSLLLQKEDKDLYPWSVCIDDLETFFLLMKKILKGIAPARFVDFLDYRERLHGHIMCFDELEICGWYLNDRRQFQEYADRDEMIAASPNMGTIFDAYYRVGLGFKKELDIDCKKKFQLPDYPKSFDMNVLTHEMIIG